MECFLEFGRLVRDAEGFITAFNYFILILTINGTNHTQMTDQVQRTIDSVHSLKSEVAQPPPIFRDHLEILGELEREVLNL